MTRRDWAKIKAEYVQGNVTLEDLAKKYEYSLSSMLKRSAKEKWSEERNIYCIKLEEKKQEKKTEILVAESDNFGSLTVAECNCFSAGLPPSCNSTG